jgi:hypothetical protein
MMDWNAKYSYYKLLLLTLDTINWYTNILIHIGAIYWDLNDTFLGSFSLMVDEITFFSFH